MKRMVTALVVMMFAVAGWIWYETANAPVSQTAVVPPHTSAEKLANRRYFQPAPHRDREFEQLREDNRKHLSAFLSDGWKVSQSPPHNPRVVGLDPTLLANNEKALRRQLQSTRVGDTLLENAVTIALEADDPPTRAAAINAVGHSPASGRNSALMELFDHLPDERERSQALGFLLPVGVDGNEGRWLVEKLSAPDVPSSLKRQIPIKLVLSGLHGSRGKEDFVDPLLDAVPHQWRDEIVASLRMYNGNNSRSARADDFSDQEPSR